MANPSPEFLRALDLDEKTKDELIDLVIDLESELSEYKRCAVLGGDGKPIGIGDIVTPIDRTLLNGTGITAPVDEMSEVYSTKLYKDGGFLILKKNGMHEASKFKKVSTTDAVPGGDT